MCPFGAITLEERPADVPRPAEVKDEGKLAVIDRETCHACGICAANCPEMAIVHNLADDDLFGRLEIMIEGVDKPIVGLYCRECTGAAISLSGMRHDPYSENVRLVGLPCLGRVSALHIIEAARLGAAGVFLAGCAEERCQYRTGDASALEQVALAGELLRGRGRASRSTSGTSAPSTGTRSGAVSDTSPRTSPIPTACRWSPPAATMRGLRRR